MNLSKIGYATYKRGKLHFDEVGWEMIKLVARRQKKSPQFVVTQALLRYARKYGKKA